MVTRIAMMAFALMLLPSAQATEAAMTAADLQELCSGSDHVSRNVCRIYILGVTEGIAQGLGIAAGNGAKACIPEEISAERLEQTIKSRLEQELSRSPARGSTAAASFLSAALAAAFPCSGSKPARP